MKCKKLDLRNLKLLKFLLPEFFSLDSQWTSMSVMYTVSAFWSLIGLRGTNQISEVTFSHSTLCKDFKSGAY